MVHAWSAPGEALVWSEVALAQEQVERYVEDSRAEARKALERLLAGVPDRPGRRSVHLLKGEPADVIAEFAKAHRVDLIVMGTVARTGIPGLLIGNTAETILQRVDCSVLAVKPDGFVSPGHLGRLTMNSSFPTVARSIVVFEARGITKLYRLGEVEVHALRGVDLELYQGEFTVLLGPSGSGKSTLLNILGGLDVPTAGTVRYRDHDLTAANDAALTHYRRDHVGFVFQFYNLIPSLTARENVALITEIAREPMTPESALELVGLVHRLDHFPAQLSGGEQQRVAIARAIAKRPDVLLCDEPTGALDVQTGVVVMEAIERVNRDLGTTTAVITHNAVIADLADRVISLSDGRVSGERRNERKAAARDLVW